MIKRSDINIRDPYILVSGGMYYLYGTRSESCWGDSADGFDCYVSRDLESFEGPVEIFRRPEGFFATRNFWAPECYEYRNSFYLVTTFGADGIKKGIYVLRSDSPQGPFSLIGMRLTPDDWTCIDGTLWFEDDIPYLIFSRSFEDGVSEGEYRIAELSSDLTHAVSEPELLFTASDAPWARPFPYAKEEFGMDGDVFFSDGPSVTEGPDGKLCMILSSWGNNGYAIGTAISESGRIHGPWKLEETPLFPENGGHGMFFRNLSGELYLTLHYPNDKYKERPVFFPVEFRNGIPVLKNTD